MLSKENDFSNTEQMESNDVTMGDVSFKISHSINNFNTDISFLQEKKVSFFFFFFFSEVQAHPGFCTQ